MARRDSRRRSGKAAAQTEDGDDREPSAQAGGLWRIRNWRLRTKLLAVLLIPLLTLLALLGLRLHSDVGRVSEYSATTARLDVAMDLAGLSRALQRERDLSVRFVAGGREGDRDMLRDARERVDSAAGRFSRAVAGAREQLDERAHDGFARVDESLRSLSDLRFRVRQSEASAAALFDSYTELVTDVLDVGEQAIAATKDSTLARYELASAAVAKLIEQHSTIRGVLSAALVEGNLSAERERALLAANAKAEAAHADFVTFGTTEQREMFASTVTGSAVQQRRTMLDAALSAPVSGPLPANIDLAGWDGATTGTISRLASVRENLHDQIESRAQTLRSQARTGLLVDLGLLVGVLLVAGVLAVLVARSLLRPMRTLRRDALEVARHRLPDAVQGMLTDSELWPDPGQWQRDLEPVPVFSRDELGQLARAFDAVHREAVRLAGEQAMLRENVNSMFVNLSRRSQDLVERQLSVLDRMEAYEQNSETLSGLFELDHLATRMRRNSENLLVLSGQELDYPVEGPVNAEEVVGAALSEIEQYQRVRVRVSPEPSVSGEVAGALVHVLSELLDNATAYSSAETEVSLVSSTDEDGTWQIEITDWGTGMPEVELQRANRRMAEPPEVDVEVSRRMGLYVVARLAARHRVDVSLSAASTGGIRANVEVPAGLVTITSPATPARTAVSETTTQLPRTVQWPDAESPVPAESDVRYGAAQPAPEQSEQPGWETESPSPPEWPSEDRDVYPLEVETPTERLPAHRDVLAEWFQPRTDGRLGDVTLLQQRVGAAAPGELEWPTSVESVWIEPYRDGRADGSSGEALPKRVPGSDVVPSATETPAMDETSEVAEPGGVGDAPTLDDLPTLRDLPLIPRSAERVRERMSGLQSGLRRGRHAGARQ